MSTVSSSLPSRNKQFSSSMVQDSPNRLYLIPSGDKREHEPESAVSTAEPSPARHPGIPTLDQLLSSSSEPTKSPNEDAQDSTRNQTARGSFSSVLQYRKLLTKGELHAALSSDKVCKKCGNASWLVTLSEFLTTCNSVSLEGLECTVKQILLWGFGRTDGLIVFTYDYKSKVLTQDDSFRSMFIACLPPTCGSVTFGEVRRAVQKMYGIAFKKVHKVFRELVSECFQNLVDLGLFPQTVPDASTLPADTSATNADALSDRLPQMLEGTPAVSPTPKVSSSAFEYDPSEMELDSLTESPLPVRPSISVDTAIDMTSLPSVPRLKGKTSRREAIEPKQETVAVKVEDDKKDDASTQEGRPPRKKRKKIEEPSVSMVKPRDEDRTRIRTKETREQKRHEASDGVAPPSFVSTEEMESILQEDDAKKSADRRYEAEYEYPKLGTKSIFYSLSRNAWVVFTTTLTGPHQTVPEQTWFRVADSSFAKAKNSAQVLNPPVLLELLKQNASNNNNSGGNQQRGKTSRDSETANMASESSLNARNPSSRSQPESEYARWTRKGKYPQMYYEKYSNMRGYRCWCHEINHKNRLKHSEDEDKPSEDVADSRRKSCQMDPRQAHVPPVDPEAFMLERLNPFRRLNSVLEFMEDYAPWEPLEPPRNLISCVEIPAEPLSNRSPFWNSRGLLNNQLDEFGSSSDDGLLTFSSFFCRDRDQRAALNEPPDTDEVPENSEIGSETQLPNGLGVLDPDADIDDILNRLPREELIQCIKTMRHLNEVRNSLHSPE